MKPNISRAGGCFLSICILAGFLWGLAVRDPVKGAVIGTGVGTVLALLTWMLDRRRAG